MASRPPFPSPPDGSSGPFGPPPPRTPRTPGRRSLLLGTAGWAVGAAGCSNGGTSSSLTPTPTAPASGGKASGGAPPASPAAVTATPGALPAVVRWLPGPGEIQPAAKLSAVRLVEALGTWRPGQGGRGPAAARARALGIAAPLAAQLASQTGSLTPPADAAVVRVIDAQYGGILSDSASVLVVCRQWTRTGTAPVRAGGTTVDVRLSRTSAGWAVTALHPARPGPAMRLTATQNAVLTSSRIELPPASAADVRSGAVHDSVLKAMLRLSRGYAISVSVVRSGHPLDVFGTNRPSDHPLGRAFDVWRIDGHRVVDPATSRALITAFMRAAAGAGSYNVGGPVLLSGGTTPNQFFSDATHHDHVHAGFSS